MNEQQLIQQPLMPELHNLIEVGLLLSNNISLEMWYSEGANFWWVALSLHFVLSALVNDEI